LQYARRQARAAYQNNALVQEDKRRDSTRVIDAAWKAFGGEIESFDEVAWQKVVEQNLMYVVSERCGREEKMVFATVLKSSIQLL
jgi:hypothetical protein